MTQEHPITPPPELFKQWFKQWEDDILNERDSVDHVLDRAWRNGFQAGADQELEACCEWLETGPYDFSIEATAPSMTKRLRAARRPKPPSLKQQALDALDSASYQPGSDFKQIDPARSAAIRRALESLPDPQD